MKIDQRPPALDFAASVVAWQRVHGRHDLPWQRDREPYRVWISEVMLQQTQVTAVLPYYERFLARFPDVATLAAAPLDDVLRLWSGLGYYARARNLHRAAREVMRVHGGVFPRTARALEALPGIGRSTAAAIAALAFGERAAILDGNVKRVLARCFGVEGWPGTPAVQARLWELAESLAPAREIETYTQGLMDLGAMVCTRTRPGCEACPVQEACVARRTGRVERFPSPRPARATPVRKASWLVVRHRGTVALEKRPTSGVWGGLWSLPELVAGKPEAGCEERFGVPPATVRRLPLLEHGFTHFRLVVRPVLCELAPQARRPRRKNMRWLSLDKAIDHAVPAPVRRLLLSIAGDRRTKAS